MVIHFVFNRQRNHLKCFKDGMLIHTWECHNVTIGSQNDDPYGPDGLCPPGDYYVGVPQILTDNEVPYGFAFTPLIDTPQTQGQAKHGRAGIGVHGGGTGSANPFAAKQGWIPTEGCFRLQNEDNYMPNSEKPCFVNTVLFAQKQGQDKILFTVA